MTPDDAIAALRRAFPAVADECVERFRRELEPVEPAQWMRDHEARSPDALALYVGASVMADICPVGTWWNWRAYKGDEWPSGLVPTRAAAMRAAEAALGLPVCEVVT